MKTSNTKEEDSDTPKSVDEGDIQIQFSPIILTAQIYGQ
jgi:hypothetical protein